MNPNDYRTGSFTIERPTNTFKIRDSKGIVWYLKTTASKELVKASVDYLRTIGSTSVGSLNSLLLWNDHTSDITVVIHDVDFIL